MRLFILSLLALTCAVNAQANDTTKQKQTLPSVEVKTIDGKAINIQEFGKTGKITIISFWATWCGPCRGEIPFLKTIEEKSKLKVQQKLKLKQVTKSKF